MAGSFLAVTRGPWLPKAHNLRPGDVSGPLTGLPKPARGLFRHIVRYIVEFVTLAAEFCHASGQNLTPTADRRRLRQRKPRQSAMVNQILTLMASKVMRREPIRLLSSELRHV